MQNGGIALDGGEGTDVADFSGMDNFLVTNGGVVVDLDNGVYDIVGNTGASLGSITGVENVIGSEHDDVLTGSSGDNVLTGGTGNDTFVLSAGNDEITDFNTAADSLDISDILGETGTIETIANSTGVLITFDMDGAGGTESSMLLKNVLGSTAGSSTSQAYDNNSVSGVSDLNTVLDNLLATDVNVIDT